MYFFLFILPARECSVCFGTYSFSVGHLIVGMLQGFLLNSLLFSFYILFQFDVIIYRVIIPHVYLLSRLLY